MTIHKKIELLAARIGESLAFLFFTTRQLAIYITFWCVFLAVIWGLDYALTGIRLGAWFVDRWFYSIPLLALAVGILIALPFRARSAWKWLESLSDPIDESTVDISAGLETGFMIFDQSLLGPVTVTASKRGIHIFQEGKIRVELGWNRLARVIASSHVGAMRAQVYLDWKQRSRSPRFEIPWRRSFDFLGRSHLRTCEPHGLADADRMKTLARTESGDD